MNKLGLQFLRYVCVGGVAFAVDFGTLYALTEIAGLHYLVSATAGFLLGLATNYAMCLVWVFHVRTLQNRVHEFVVCGLVGMAGLILNNLILAGLTELLKFHYLASKMVAAAAILVFNFSLRRTILFSGPAASMPIDRDRP